ncbi:hypothetical protein [uncultured Brevibacillus sp.]|uniref:hypothetical protein n=1 Tax=uncultured Brevibacillus sp. TaxID=169970 RepID=UPI002594D7F0|nr:hypothetical protein [uncultured Brevibacillus sp.]
MIFDAIEKYQDYYSVDKKGYRLNEEASQVIPEITYKLLKETFDKANEMYKNKGNNKIGKSVKGGELTSEIASERTSDDGISLFAVDEGYRYYEKDSDTYYFEGTIGMLVIGST